VNSCKLQELHVSYKVKSYEVKLFQRREATIRYQSVLLSMKTHQTTSKPKRIVLQLQASTTDGWYPSISLDFCRVPKHYRPALRVNRFWARTPGFPHLQRKEFVRKRAERHRISFGEGQMNECAKMKSRLVVSAPVVLHYPSRMLNIVIKITSE
jgi:hypothetical protein